MTYRTLVADPPWTYDNTRGTQTRSRGGRSKTTAQGHYPTMTTDEIAALPVGDLAEPNAHLYLWATNTLLEQAFPIMRAWGFRYVTMLTWVKTGAPGLGFSFRGHTEHVLFGVKGKLPIPAPKRETNVFNGPRKAHSQKPEAFYDLVERVSPGPYLELFARRNRLGWSTWGDECLVHEEIA